VADPSSESVTELLERCRTGDRAALDQLLPVVYAELRHLAKSYLRRERGNHTLQSTALVHEAYLRLSQGVAAEWRNRTHFFGIAANLMRQVLVDHARARGAVKRGGGAHRVTLTGIADERDTLAIDFTALDAALTTLAAMDPTQARIVELRFFAGLTIEETAELLALSPATIKREWATARAWLHRELEEPGTGPA
jgi:RNA polymerase sigma-70 factor (ECF subfamily)